MVDAKTWSDMERKSNDVLVVSTVMSGILFARFPIVDYVTQL